MSRAPTTRFFSRSDSGWPGTEGIQAMEIVGRKKYRVKLESEERRRRCVQDGLEAALGRAAPRRTASRASWTARARRS